jgi:pimeloyl-ACP methyl ester carboxylesterase
VTALRATRARRLVRGRGARGLGVVLAAALLALLGAPAALGGGDKHYPAPPAPPPPPSAVEVGHASVKVKVNDTIVLAGTYASNGAKPGSPAVLLVHGENQARMAWAPLWPELDEHRVPWLAIDLRGFGESRVQGSHDFGVDVEKKDPATFLSLSEDVAAGIRFLVAEKGHDKEKIGVLASRLGAVAALKLAHDDKQAMAALQLMSPNALYPGFESQKDASDTNGKMDFVVFTSVEDTKVDEKRNALRILYLAEAARNAPPETPLDERIKKRRGIPPRFRAFAETGVTGTAMITGVAHFDAWLAAWWGRRFGTYPHAVLYDGSVDRKNDYADPEWDFGTDIPSKWGTAKALRWGRRVMVGGSLPKDVRSIHLRIHGSRGDRQQAGQFARVDYPNGIVTANPLVRGFGRAPSTETSALVLEPEEIPVKQGRETVLTYGDPSFEVEFRLPEVSGNGPYIVHVSWAISRAGGEPENDDKYDERDPETWTLVPDQLEGTGIPYVPPEFVPTAPGKTNETPDGPFGGR